MTAAELRRILEGRDDYLLTIAKSDPGQVSARTTVPVRSADVGFDWTHGQIVLTPEAKLTTHPEEMDRQMREHLEQLSERLTRHMSLAAKISRMLVGCDKEIEVRELLKQF